MLGQQLSKNTKLLAWTMIEAATGEPMSFYLTPPPKKKVERTEIVGAIKHKSSVALDVPITITELQ